MQHKITVVGSGAFGVAIANHLVERGYDVKLLAKNQNVADLINKHHRSDRLRGISLSEKLKAYTDLSSAFDESDIIISAIVSHKLRGFLVDTASYWPKNAIIISASKGLEEDTFDRMSQIIIKELGISSKQVAVLSGPNLAKEIAQGKGSSSVIASESQETIDICQDLLHSSTFRVYTRKDVIGVELCGAAKNVIAIAAGMCSSANTLLLGENERAALATRGKEEIKRLGLVLGANAGTFDGLAGVGDIMVTCTSPASRNYQFGHQVGKGNKPEDVLENISGEVEGLKTVYPLYGLAKKHNVRMPIVFAVYGVVTGQITVEQAVNSLMLSGGKPEED